jgi:uracil-DNA glycosylase
MKETVKVNYKELLKDWEAPLHDRVLDSAYMDRLLYTTLKSYKLGTVYPAKEDIFRPFKITSFKDTRVVIIGQDPYSDGKATGLAFGNEEEDAQFKMSPPLEKIYSCIERTVYNGMKLDFDPTLESWAHQGVLLLNSAMTVEKGKVGSHVSRWRRFIREVIQTIDEEKVGVCFLFLGAQAKMYMDYVNTKRHYVFSYMHPTVASKQDIDWNCPYFKEINNIIELQNGREFCIEW